jgi:hypothetical protein
LAAVDKVLIDQGHRHAPGAGVGGAIHSYTRAEESAGVAR